MVTDFILTKYDVTENFYLNPDSWFEIKLRILFLLSTSIQDRSQLGVHPQIFTMEITIDFTFKILVNQVKIF